MISLRLLLRFMSNPENPIYVENYSKMHSISPPPPKKIDLSTDRPAALEAVQKILESGGCVALPTDTVYGLVTLLKFSHKLFLAKKRLLTKPVALFVHSPEMIKRYAEQTVSDQFLTRLLPGKVTLLFKRLPTVPDDFKTDLIGFRIPDDEFIQKLCQRFDEPLAQTSANLSGEPSAIRPEEFSAIWKDLDLILIDTDRMLDESRRGSTIIDLSYPGTYHIKREGCSLTYYENILRESNLRPR